METKEEVEDYTKEITVNEVEAKWLITRIESIEGTIRRCDGDISGNLVKIILDTTKQLLKL